MNKVRKILRQVVFLMLSLVLIFSAGFQLPALAQRGGPQTDGSQDGGVGPGYLPETRKLEPPGLVGFLSSPTSGDPRAIALRFLADHRDALGLEQADLVNVFVSDQYTDEYNGVTHIYLQQRFKGIDVLGANLSTNVARDGSVINVSSSFISGVAGAVSGIPARSAQQAISDAAQHLGLVVPPGLRIAEQRGGPMSEIVFVADGLSLEPVSTRLVYQPVAPGKVRLARQVEIYPLDARHWWILSVDSETGVVLSQLDYVSDSDGLFTPGVGTYTSSRQLGSLFSASPSDSGSYRVFELPKESPSDGNRSLAVNPASALASPYGWHDTDGKDGAEYTITRGNNVYAYTDLNADNVPDIGSAPDGGALLKFDFPLDLTQPPSAYRPAAVTNLFYWNNIIHDVLVGYGFTEPAGNFQVNNYTNQGKGKDPVQAEAQDGSGTDNANFATPPDGKQPRMQMFVWKYPLPITIHVTAPSGAVGDYAASGADFGPSLQAVGPLSGTAIVVNDGAGVSLTDACEPLVGFQAGAIAIVDRGNCFFVTKVKNAQNAGAIAVIVINNVSGTPITMGGTDSTIVIPSVMVTLEDGGIFKANAPLTLTMAFESIGIDRDSDLDSGVIVHEYGHGVSNRLTGGPSKVNCLSNPEEMGEGWSDFLALAFTAIPSDKATTPRGIGTYLIFEAPDGIGIRPTPYTTDMSVNPATYASIVTNGEVHFTGYVWASMLWEVYWNLVGAHGFNQNLYDSWQTGGNNLTLQLVLDGMKLQSCRPGFVDGRNAILQADQVLTGGANQCHIWEGFAKRGLGYSASQGSSNSTTDGTQAFDLPASCMP